MAAKRLNALAETCFMCLAFFGPVACSFVLLHLIGSYWAYFDIGINRAANSFTLVFLYAPATLVFFYVGTSVAALAARGTRLSPWVSAAWLFVTMIALVSAAFLLEVWRTGDYPTMPGRDMTGFLADYFGHWRVYATR